MPPGLSGICTRLKRNACFDDSRSLVEKPGRPRLAAGHCGRLCQAFLQLDEQFLLGDLGQFAIVFVDTIPQKSLPNTFSTNSTGVALWLP